MRVVSCHVAGSAVLKGKGSRNGNRGGRHDMERTRKEEEGTQGWGHGCVIAQVTKSGKAQF